MVPKSSMRSKLSAIQPKVHSTATAEWVREGVLELGRTQLVTLEPTVPALDLIAWGRENLDVIKDRLTTRGAVLFRGFSVTSATEFEGFVTSLGGDTLEYKERSSPRRNVGAKVYTSTEYPANQTIFPHNENSYAHVWPRKIAFFCVNPGTSGGETPIADVRRVYERIPTEVRERFIDKGILYVRNFSPTLGLSWQEAFQTADREQVNEYCASAGYQTTWLDNNRLRTKRHGIAVVPHPATKEALWFNHAAFFHVSTLPLEVQTALLSQCGEEHLPNQSYYGDGSPIEGEALDAIRESYAAATLVFPWQKGDVLLLDNMLVAHARKPFQGPRQILVCMSEPFESSQLSSSRY